MNRKEVTEVALDPIVAEFGQGDYTTFTIVIDDPRLEYEPEIGMLRVAPFEESTVEEAEMRFSIA